MNKEKDNKLLITDYKNEFSFEKKIFFSFNRLAFIFFLIITLSILYSTEFFILQLKIQMVQFMRSLLITI